MFRVCSDTPPNDTPADSGDVGGLTDADINSNWDEVIETFDGMELPEALLRGIYSYGFEKPSAIQQRAIRPAISGRDLIAQAQSGTVSLFCYEKRRRTERWCPSCLHAKGFRDDDFLLNTIFRV